MTNEECMDLLHDIKTDAVYNLLSEEREALDMAIKVLENQKYVIKEVYIKGYDYGVKDWFKAKTDKSDIKAEIIKRIEQVRDNDKNAGEYPYNRCIEIIKEVMG